MNRRKFIYNSSIASLSVMGLQSCNILDRNVKISILHTNDVHSQIEAFPFNHNVYPIEEDLLKEPIYLKD